MEEKLTLVRPGKSFELPNGETFTFQFEPPAWFPCNDEELDAGVSFHNADAFDKELHALTTILVNLGDLAVGRRWERYVLLWHLYRRLDAFLQWNAWCMSKGISNMEEALESIKAFDDFAAEHHDDDDEDEDDDGPKTELGMALAAIFGGR